ncbi:MAG TPA: O-antigen ligase family protein [Stellaceae bacterium]|nr:O-antigen ligase family protein [Stellaceae bacterium]
MAGSAERRRSLSWCARVLASCALLLPPLAVFDPLALAPLFALAAVAIVALDRRALRDALRPLAPLALLLALLAGLATLSAAWSIVPLHSFLEGLRLGAIAAGTLLLLAAARAVDADERGRIAAAAAIGFGIAAALLLEEAITGAALTRLVLHRETVPLQRFDRGATTLVLALWPALVGAAWRAAIARAALAVAALAAVFALDSAGAALAIVAGLVAFALAWFAPRTVAVALALGLAAIAIALPVAAPGDRTVLALRHDAPWIKWSGIHRLLIWRFTADRIAERPLLGWGMDASRALPGGKTSFADLYPEAGLPSTAEALPLHPHDAALQWQVELGIPGTVLGLAIVAWGVWCAGAAPGLSRLTRAGALAWATSALVIALLAYGAWQAWWLASLALTAALLVTAAAGGTPADSAGSPARHPP